MRQVLYATQRSPGGGRSSPLGTRLRALGLAACGVALAAAPAMAQSGVVAGVVTDPGQSPIASAQVTVRGTRLGSVTDDAGHFQITGVPGSTVTLDVRRLGYHGDTVTVNVGDTNIHVTLTASAINLNTVVVTGTPTGAQKREIGNAVTQIDAARVAKVAPIQSLQQLINGRAPNVVIMPGTGEVGTGAKIRVRGTSSLGLAQTPLIYIDGVRTDNAQATGPANQAFGSSTISRWNDIDPEDIERIEIIKGPSASTLYGTEASNGVVNIITKHGAAGQTRYSLNLQQGTNFFLNPDGRFPTNYNMVNGQLETIDFAQLNNLYKQHTGDNIFNYGHLQKFQGSASGGTDQFQYYVSAVQESDRGIEPTNSLRRTSGRANLGIQLNQHLKVDANLNFLTGKTNLSPEAGYGGRMWTVYNMDPANLSDSLSYGFYSGMPWGYDEEYHIFQRINRFTGGFHISHDPTSWFSQRLSIGEDQVNTSDVELYSRIDSLSKWGFDPDNLGLRAQTNNDVTFQTVDYAATARVHLGSAITAATSVGGQYYRTRSEPTGVFGDVFPAPGVTSIDATIQDRAPSEDVTENATLGYYVQEQLGWQDRRYLTLALRSDKNSAFGADFGRVYYPKASASWVLSDEPFFHVPVFSSLRLRAAYGESGEQPDQFAATRAYAPATGPGDAAAVTPLSIGNPNLGPERGKELEAGFDAGLLNERVALEFTYYNKRTTDAILEEQIAPSVGFSATRFVNAGEVQNHGVELLARVTPIQNSTVTWDASFTLATNNNKITKLGLEGANCISAGTYVQNCEGFPVGSWFLQRIVSAQLDSAGNAVNIKCDSVGVATSCANAPLEYFGNSIPKHEGSFTSTVTLWGRLRFYGLVDFQTGQKKLNGNERLTCYFRLGGECRQRFFPQEYDPTLIAGIQKQMPGYLIQSASFAKLRELSVSYTVPENLVAKLGAQTGSLTLAGHNLHTWTDYPGLEPEAFFLGGSRSGNASWEQTAVPQLTSFTLAVNLTF
ncbi:MAG TPA: SusC/RagA family TonB-linked outer membrane protein [Gemmatimonadaceae bacterium]